VSAVRPGMAPETLAERISPLIRFEIAGIGAIETAIAHEKHPGYVMLLQEAKSSKQASVEQMGTLLRIAAQPRVHGGGVMEPVLRLEALALQMAGTSALLGAMRTVESILLTQYADAREVLAGREHRAVEVAAHRARKRWMILTAHLAQRKAADASEAQALPFPLSRYFAGDEDRVCMRCLLDRPGPKPALEKQDPYTYLCGACHAEAVAAFPPDLRAQMPRWREQDRHDRVIHKALGRPLKLAAIKEVHARLAGLPSEAPPSAGMRKAAPVAEDAGRGTNDGQPPSTLSVPDAGTGAEEAAYTALLFDYRSVRHWW